MDKPKIKKPTDDPMDDLRRNARAIQIAAARIDPDYAIELGEKLKSERRKKKAIANLVKTT